MHILAIANGRGHVAHQPPKLEELNLPPAVAGIRAALAGVEESQYGRVVTVDVFLPGCPPHADLIYTLLDDLLSGRVPEAIGSRFGR